VFFNTKSLACARLFDFDRMPDQVGNDANGDGGSLTAILPRVPACVHAAHAGHNFAASFAGLHGAHRAAAK
jgi:hypothetical protein